MMPPDAAEDGGRRLRVAHPVLRIATFLVRKALVPVRGVDIGETEVAKIVVSPIQSNRKSR
jgi:hypothetical protein